MRRVVLPLLLICSGCATDLRRRDVPEGTVPSSATFIISGQLRFEDGDRLLVACQRPEPCEEMLVRDERLQREAIALQGQRLTLRVQRVSGCGANSSEAVCLRGASSALRIVKWLDVQD